MCGRAAAVKDDFQSLLRSLRVCFRFCFCFEFVDVLHFGNSIHEVFESAITGRYVYECSHSRPQSPSCPLAAAPGHTIRGALETHDSGSPRF